jgi:hypothetical protein
MDPFRTGKLVLFQVSYDRDWHYFEIPAYLIIGLFGVSPPATRPRSAANEAGVVRRIRHQVQPANGGL